MSFGDIAKAFTGSGVNRTIEAMQDVAKDEQLELRAEQLESKAAFKEMQSEAVNPFAARFATKEKPIKASSTRIQKMQQSGVNEKRLLPIGQIKDMAGQFEKRNPELRANVLVMLREYIKPDDTKEDILRKLLEFYPDVSLADEALTFLMDTSEGDLKEKLREIKSEFSQQFDREITAGRNIETQARQASDKGLGTPTTLRDLYRDITGNPRDSTTLFDELSQKYPFKELKKVTDFLFHSLGADLKAKGPSIPPGLLQRLMAETRSLQAILGVYRFFQGRMNLVESQFEKEGLDKPPQLSFENMAKAFMALASERYPSANKVKDSAVRLGVEKWIPAKIIALSQIRDAVKEVAMNQIYKSVPHRDELYMATIEALEDLEDELEELVDTQKDADDNIEKVTKQKTDKKKDADDDEEEITKILKGR